MKLPWHEEKYKRPDDHPASEFEQWERWMTEQSADPPKGTEDFWAVYDMMSILERIGLFAYTNQISALADGYEDYWRV